MFCENDNSKLLRPRPNGKHAPLIILKMSNFDCLIPLELTNISKIETVLLQVEKALALVPFEPVADHVM